MKLGLLFVCLLIGVIYQTIPYDSEPLKLFVFSDVALPFKTWVYFVGEHLVLIMLGYIIASEEKYYTVAAKTFFFIQIADLADYLLTYNSNWLGFISFNVISFIVFGSSIVYELNKDGQ